MSYCRWSSDNWKSDVYAYESVHGGFQIEVARSKIIDALPPVPSIGSVTPDEWLAAHRLQMDTLHSAPRRSVPEPIGGYSHHADDLEGFLAVMLSLQSQGLHVPADAIEDIRREMEAEVSP